MEKTFVLFVFFFFGTTCNMKMTYEEPVVPISLTNKPLHTAKESFPFNRAILKKLLPYISVYDKDLIVNVSLNDDETSKKYLDSLNVLDLPIKTFNNAKENDRIRIVIQSRGNQYKPFFLQLSQKQKSNQLFEDALQKKLTAYKKNKES